MSTPIKHIVAILEDKREGRYYGFRYTRVADRAFCEGQISGGDSNVRAAFSFTDHPPRPVSRRNLSPSR